MMWDVNDIHPTLKGQTSSRLSISFALFGVTSLKRWRTYPPACRRKPIITLCERI